MSGCTCHPSSAGCRVDGRRALLLGNADWNGIDYIDVLDDQPALCVHMFGRVPELTVDQVRVCGGRRIRDIKVVGVEIRRAEEPEFDDCLHVRLDRTGDFSTYCLCIGVPAKRKVDACGNAIDDGTPDWQPLPGFDKRYACVEFSFKAGCSTPYDCAPEQTCPTALPEAPAIDYLAKDYDSFKQLIFDRLAVTLPEWRERHVPDIGVAIVEVLAYVADRLSYYQDAVATEGYLRTARRRTSIRRHARLVDYRMHEGCNARAWLTVSANVDGPLPLEAVAFSTRPVGLTSSSVVHTRDLEPLPSTGYIWFEALSPPRTTGTFDVVADQSEIHFYTWGGTECCLPRGAVRATLRDRPKEGRTALGLRPGDVLIFEEVVGPTTGNPADADPTHRHAVRLTAVRADRDPLVPSIDSTGKRESDDTPVIEIEWSADDALPFPVCISSRTATCVDVTNVSVARGNVILVDHGRTYRDGDKWTVEKSIEQVSCGCGPGSVPEIVKVPARLSPSLSRSPLTFAEPTTDGFCASRVLTQDPRAAMPSIWLAETVHVTGGDATPSRKKAPLSNKWQARLDLIASQGDDRDFVVEVDDDRLASLRFGDGVHGRQPEATLTLTATYRIGSGKAGNVGADSIVCVVADTTPLDGLVVRNPLPAVGGLDPEPVDEVKLFAPGAIRRRQVRAVIADDYAAFARLDPSLQSVAASLSWTGSWYEADVAVDPFGADSASPALRASVATRLESVRRLGHDVAVPEAHIVPLVVEVSVCVKDDYLTSHVRAVLRDRLGSRALPDGTVGLFHPDRLRFAQSVYVSAIVAEAQRVDGVRHVEVTRLERFPGNANNPDPEALISGVLAMRSTEIAEVANDPNFPERGSLTLTMKGGR